MPSLLLCLIPIIKINKLQILALNNFSFYFDDRGFAYSRINSLKTDQEGNTSLTYLWSHHFLWCITQGNEELSGFSSLQKGLELGPK